MRLENFLKELVGLTRGLSEDTLKTARGDDNLLAILRIDTDDEGNYWEVVVINTDTDKEYSRERFRDEKEAEKEFKKTVKEF